MTSSEILIRDPFILPYQGKYYLYGTRSETAFARKAFGFDVYVSEDLRNWSAPAECFHRPEGFWATMHYWAPEVHLYRDVFYMFATFSDGKLQGTSILRSESPLGPFRLWSEGTITPQNWATLDGTFYVGKDGAPYMVFCHEWKQVHDGAVCAVRLSEDLRRPAGEPFVLFTASQGRPLTHSYFLRNYVTDGPFLLRTGDGKLHMLWSSFGKNHKYVQALAHSDNDDITGKWRIDDRLLYDQDGGHGMIFVTREGNLCLTLHSPNRLKKEHPVFIPIRYQDGVLAIAPGKEGAT